MEIKITINAPGLEDAINNLAKAISTKQVNTESTKQPKQEVVNPEPVQPQVPVQQAPVQQEVIQEQVPTQQQAPIQQQQVPVQQQAPVQQEQPQQQAVPTTNPTYTMDQLAVAATQLMDAGRRDELINLLSQFVNPPVLMNLPEDQYGAFATKLRELGAKL